MSSEPLTPEQVDALLRPDPRTPAADMLVLRDALLRLGDAWDRLAEAADTLQTVAEDIGRARRAPRGDAPDAVEPPPVAPRAD